MRLVSSRKGVSEIIAALLVVTITISAMTLFAVYASGVMGSILKPAGQQPYTEQLSSEYYNWNTLSSLVVDIRNTGVATVNLQTNTGVATADYYLSGIKLTTAPTISCVAPATPTAITPGGACTLTFTLTASSYTSGIAYVLKIVFMTDGTMFTFSYVAGSTTH